MTAIDGLDRFETPALWRPGPDAPGHPVYVSIGEAELVVLDGDEMVLSHWALPAMRRLNPGALPALYAPGRQAEETIEVEDPDMVATLERILAAVPRDPRGAAGRLRWIATATAVAVAAVALAWWLPGAMRDHASRILPPAQRTDIGERLLVELTRVTGPPCATPLGTEALTTLRDNLDPASRLRLRVVQDMPRDALRLPGDLLIVSNDLLRGIDDPGPTGARVRAAMGDDRSPLDRFLADLSVADLTRLLTGGELPDAAFGRHVQSVLRLDEGPAPEPLANAVLDDTDWQNLRAICDG
ncbi:hypothetical protein [Jannaschia sp. LMIT008]|uniref:hypothetical protein n=1 Tax=Jannaschia maritima TaxID=3032585 RepID=UPI00281208C3|nr:hypothetical protein [Jannaschia sp. LMIT008]